MPLPDIVPTDPKDFGPCSTAPSGVHEFVNGTCFRCGTPHVKLRMVYTMGRLKVLDYLRRLYAKAPRKPQP